MTAALARIKALGRLCNRILNHGGNFYHLPRSPLIPIDRAVGSRGLMQPYIISPSDLTFRMQNLEGETASENRNAQRFKSRSLSMITRLVIDLIIIDR